MRDEDDKKNLNRCKETQKEGKRKKKNKQEENTKKESVLE
jgi:hypothetical protein